MTQVLDKTDLTLFFTGGAPAIRVENPAHPHPDHDLLTEPDSGPGRGRQVG